MRREIVQSDCEEYLKEARHEELDLSFVDPPFNQGKEYKNHNDLMPEADYWAWMERVCKLIYDRTSIGGAVYFMQREKNAQFVLDTLDNAGWTYQNLIIWKKKTSAVPSNTRFGKHYQIIAFATKGRKPRVFHRLRINPPLLVTQKLARPRGKYVTDVWDDIRELTSGYFAGNEAIRDKSGERVHKQQSPIELLIRIILSSTYLGDTVFDPFAGTGTTLVVAQQLLRNAVATEIDPDNVHLIENRIANLRQSDDVLRFRDDYKFTDGLDNIWPLLHDEQKYVVMKLFD